MRVFNISSHLFLEEIVLHGQDDGQQHHARHQSGATRVFLVDEEGVARDNEPGAVQNGVLPTSHEGEVSKVCFVHQENEAFIYIDVFIS